MQQHVGFVAIGLDHRHICTQAQHMIDAGARFLGWWTDGSPETLPEFTRGFPVVPRFDERADLLSCPDANLALIAAVPADRAGLAIEAMQQGLDVMTDKPGCTTLEQLDAIRNTVARTGRIWSVNFSERFEVPGVTRASELVADGAIGRVVQTLGLGPHRLNRSARPDWFFQRERTGGILCDIASHQIDQFLHFTGSTDAEITLAQVGNYANPGDRELQDFGQIALQSASGLGYIRVDWYSPDGLPTWGDGRLTILGTEGYLELRKYVDIAGAGGTDHLFLVNGAQCRKIDCSDVNITYFSALCDDILNRTDTAMKQEYSFKVMELAIRAQMIAEATP